MEFASICKENFGYLCFFQKGSLIFKLFKRAYVLVRAIFIFEKSEVY